MVVDHLFVVIALLLIGLLAFCVAFVPPVFPSLVNKYYSLIGMKTRIAQEDYSRVGVRLAGAIILSAELVWLYLRWHKART
jgi:hypothetical protein